MLFEMICGHPPFEGEGAPRVMIMHVNDPVPDLSSRVPETPSQLKWIAEKALSKKPEGRFESAGAMATALRHADLTPASDAQIETLAARPKSDEIKEAIAAYRAAAPPESLQPTWKGMAARRA
jgi:eukaryotic-like serine/threonine-protein kinase